MIKYRIKKIGNFWRPQIKKLWWWTDLLALDYIPKTYRKERDAKQAINNYIRYGKHHTIGKLGRMI